MYRGREKAQSRQGSKSTYPTKTFWYAGSGRTYTRRVRTSEAQHLTIAHVKEQLPSIRRELERHVLYVDEHLGDDGAVSLQVKQTPPGLSLRFEVSQQRRGTRHWFRCVSCERRAGKLYRVELRVGVVWGCQRCLRLAYPSQAQHKTRARDSAICEGGVQVGHSEQVQALSRERVRRDRFIAGLSRRAFRSLSRS